MISIKHVPNNKVCNHESETVEQFKLTDWTKTHFEEGWSYHMLSLLVVQVSLKLQKLHDEAYDFIEELQSCTIATCYALETYKMHVDFLKWYGT